MWGRRWRGALACALATAAAAGCSDSDRSAQDVEHLVVIYQENKSFDVYFGIYPSAANPPGQPVFRAKPDTPRVNGLTDMLLFDNPNEANPFRIDRTQSYTCDQSHDYTTEQQSRNGGAMDRFVQFDAEPPTNPRQFCTETASGQWDTLMGYFDGNTVTALWNYAQHFVIGDDFFASNFGESTRGALNLAVGSTYGVVCGESGHVYGDVPECGGPVDSTTIAAPTNGNVGTLNVDTDPYWDVCGGGYGLAAFTGRNVGDLLNDAGVTWGWFQGGFTLDASGQCTSSHPLEAYDRATGVDPATDPLRFVDYVPHHNPFQYFASTANPWHLPPTSVDMVGKSDQANHLYDLSWFWPAAEAGNLPTVSFLKPPAYQNGHPGNSTPLDEQVFLVETLNRLQALPEWRSMVVIVAWDDSDGWYDHVSPPIVNRSATPLDFLCGDVTDGPGARCGYGPRLPFVVVSPFAKQNHVSHDVMDQASILRFIEDRWVGGERISETSFDRLSGSIADVFDFAGAPAPKLFLDPDTGTVRSGA
ncbi:MAG TPA: alkaline phosphatase family protein [Candidatus Binatia bacterium]|nr:alkaline phosphatase family protein [Candidatus Binatia bacterium]